MDEENRFTLDLTAENTIKKIKILPHRTYSITNLKVNANIKTDITKRKDYDKIHALSNFCHKLIKDNKKRLFNNSFEFGKK